MNNHKYIPVLLSFLAGFLSLSQEILWVKIIGFIYFSTPKAFAFVLTLYLIGIAIGAMIGKIFCQKYNNSSLYTICGYFFLSAALLDSIFAILVSMVPFESPLSPQLCTYAILTCAALRGVVFPILHHIGSQNTNKVGSSIANVYSANVFGSTLGPLITGFIFLDYLSLQQTILTINIITCLVSLYILKDSAKYIIANSIFIIIAIVLMLPQHDYIIKFLTKNSLPVKYISQNKHGIIHVLSKDTGDVVFGGNVYDGTTNLSLVANSNKIHRAYMIPILAPKLEKVLVIGLSTGAWLKILSSVPNIKQITVIEINDGYLDIIKKHSHLASILHDPRIKIEITDGRQWLNRHPNEKFDFILMNTTFHWRSYTTNLLSQDFLTILHHHLYPHGSVYYNSTGSEQAYYTAKAVFNYVYRYDNFVFASKISSQFSNDMASNFNTLTKLTWDNQQKVFSFTDEERHAIDKMLAVPLVLFTKEDNSQIITDDNMLTEYKYGRAFWP